MVPRSQLRLMRVLFVFTTVLMVILIHNFWTEQDLCQTPSHLLIGWTNISSIATFEGIRYNGRPLMVGGSYRPDECRPKHKVAVVVPYRNRSLQLAVFLNFIHPFLQRQQLDYTVFIVEQSEIPALPFNRGMLMNIGFVEALRRQRFDCFVFHDVDLLPEDDRNPYSCPEREFPRHLSVAINTFGYRPIGENHFGGVSSLTTDDFLSVNGFSNAFWGWGGEDDDLFERLRLRNLSKKYCTVNGARAFLVLCLSRHMCLMKQRAESARAPFTVQYFLERFHSSASSPVAPNALHDAPTRTGSTQP